MKKYSLIFLLGNLAVLQLPTLESLYLKTLLNVSLVLIIILIILGYFLNSYQIKLSLFSKKVIYTSILALLFFNLAVLLTWHEASKRLSQNLPEQVESQEVVITAIIDSIPSVSIEKPRWSKKSSSAIDSISYKAKFVVKIIDWDYPQQFDFKGRVKLSWYQLDQNLSNKLKVGDIWRFKVKMKRPSGLMNPGGFDYEKWLFQENIRATGYIRANKKQDDFDKLNIPIGQDISLSYRLDRFRQQTADKLRILLSDNAYKGIFLALILGIKDDITDEQWQVFTTTGTNHLMAISGLHIGLIAGLAFLLGRKLWSLSERTINRLPAQQFGALFGLVFALVYAGLAGFSIPTQRALIMLSFVLTGVLLKIKLPSLSILAYALLVILCFDPLASLSMGFWLSFTAVAVILFTLTWQKIRKNQEFKEQGSKEQCLKEQESNIKNSVIKSELNPIKYQLVKIWQTIQQLTVIQLVLFIGLLPISTLFFGYFSLFSPIANFVVVPWMSILVIPLALISALLADIFPQISVHLFNLNEIFLDGVWSFLSYLVSSQYNVVSLAIYPVVIGVLAVLGFIVIFKKKKVKSTLLGLCLIIPILLPKQMLPEWFGWKPEPAKGQYRLSVMDVGQGLSVVVQTQHHTMIYDTGNAYSKRFNMADQVLIPFLKARRIKKLDLLVLSHADNDHAAASNSLLKSYPAEQILSGEAKRINHKFSLNPLSCYAGQEWIWDDVTFRVISPDKDLKYKKNNNWSCVIVVSDKNEFTTLLTGDIEKKIEKSILNDQKNKLILANLNLLVAAHHGSNTSSHLEFVNLVKAENVLYSNGYKHHFNFPNSHVVTRFTSSNTHQESTINGMIEILTPIKKKNLKGDKRVGKNKSKLEVYRKDYRSLWHRPYQKI